MNIASQVEMGRLRHPGHPALAFEGREYSYRELDRYAAGAARRLLAMGVRREERVGLCLPNSPEFVFWYLGALRIGAIAVCLNPRLTEEELGFMIEDSGARVVLRNPELPEPDEFPTEDLPAEAPAVIVYTSGTTGFPKGAVLSHGNVLFVSEAKTRYLQIAPDDRMLLFLPLFHCFGQNAIMNAAFAGGATVELQRSFEPASAARAIADGRVTIACGVPTHFIVLSDHMEPGHTGRLRRCMSAAAPLPLAVERRWRERFGIPLNQGYGLTECAPFTAFNHLTDYREGSAGVAIDGVEMGVVDEENGSFLPAGKSGEIVLRGPNVMLGYWRRPEETAQAITDGWLHTGDIGYCDRDGYFYVQDRLKDMVIVGGYNVYPVEVENVLHRHPSVAEVAVYGAPDPLMGERVRAAVVLRKGGAASGDELRAFCVPHLSSYKLPVDFEFMPDLPKGSTGKVLKRALRERYRSSNGKAPGAAAPVRTVAEVERWITGWLSVRMNVPEPVDPGRTVADYGFTSLVALEFAGELSRWLEREIQPTITWSYPTPAALARYLMAAAAVGSAATDEALGAEIAALSDSEAEEMLRAELRKFANAQAAGRG
jgi:long-chain acyl-CoA synthetase